MQSYRLDTYAGVDCLFVVGNRVPSYILVEHVKATEADRRKAARAVADGILKNDRAVFVRKGVVAVRVNVQATVIISASVSLVLQFFKVRAL